MLTLVLQCVVAVLKLGFGIAAFGVVRRLRDTVEPKGAAWVLTAYTFTLGGLILCVQNFLAPAAYFGGAKSEAYRMFTRFLPVGNYARTVSMICFALGLLALSRIPRPGRPRVMAGLVALSVAGALAGAGLGALEEQLSAVRHFPNLAILSSAQLLAFLAALFVALLANSADRMLWGALGAYAFHEALNTFYFGALMNVDTPNTWSPSPSQVQMYGAAIWAIMIGFAVHRWRVAARGGEVLGLLEAPVAQQHATFGH